MSSSHAISIGTDHTLSATLLDGAGAAITGATCEVTIYENDGETEVDGETWPLTMTHVGSGVYEVNLADTINFDSNNKYQLEIDITDNSSPPNKALVKDIIYIDGNGSA